MSAWASFENRPTIRAPTSGQANLKHHSLHTPVLEHAGATEDEVDNLPAPLLCCRQDFFNRRPGSTLKYEVLQVKVGAYAVCRCKQTTGSLLNAFICQAGVITFASTQPKNLADGDSDL